MKKANKLLSVIIIAFLIGAAIFHNSNYNVKAQSLDRANLCFEQTIELIYDEQIDFLSYERQEVYNYGLEAFGYAYTMNLNGLKGFALMINRGQFYEVTEVYENKILPYNGIEGLAVYLTPLSYIECREEIYYDIESGDILEEDILLVLSERGFGFEGGVPGQTITEPVSYTSKQEEAYRIPGTFPSYINANPALTNMCAVNAGSVVVGYWGRYFPELMPNFTVGRMLGSSMA